MSTESSAATVEITAEAEAHLTELVSLRDWLRHHFPDEDPSLLALDWVLRVLLEPRLPTVDDIEGILRDA